MMTDPDPDPHTLLYLLLQIVPSTQSRGTRKSYFTFYFTQKLYGTGVPQVYNPNFSTWTF